MTLWQKLAWLAAGGLIGTLARFGLTGLAQRFFERAFSGLSQTGQPGGSGVFLPWGTLTVNVVGCFLFGLGSSLAHPGFKVDTPMRLAFFVGFLGAFTTFSTYAFDTGQMLRQSQWVMAAVHMLAQNGLGVAALFLGFWVGKAFY